MLRVRGTCAEDTRATQVQEVAASLNSEDVFILETPGNTWIWTGEVICFGPTEFDPRINSVSNLRFYHLNQLR